MRLCRRIETNYSYSDV